MDEAMGAGTATIPTPPTSLTDRSSQVQKQITVLHFCEHFGGRRASLHGVARAFQWWIPEFDSTRFRILLCSRAGRDAAARGMEATGLDVQTLGRGKMDPRNITSLRRMVEREGVDLIHAHGFGACAWARIVGRMTRTPVIVHGRCNYGRVPLTAEPFELALGPGTRYALAVSESTKQFMAEKRHIPADVIEVLYNGILLDSVPRLSPQRRAELRSELGMADDVFAFGVVSRIVSHKGHLDAFRAMERLVRLRPNAKLWVFGDGHYAPALHEWIEEHEAEGYIKMAGFRRDIVEVIQCLDVQVFPSHEEGTPNTLFEALAVGNAMVATPVDGQGELLADGETALMFPTGDDATLADCMQRLMDHPEKREALRAAARARAEDLDGHKTVRRMEALYERIMRETRG